MAYRDEFDRVLRENEEIRKALAKARSDARFTAIRQVLLAFAFGLSWSVLDPDASAAAQANDRCVPPPFGHGWLEVRPDAGSRFVIDESIHGSVATRFAMPAGKHRVRFNGPYGDHWSTVRVYDGRTAWAFDGESRESR